MDIRFSNQDALFAVDNQQIENLKPVAEAALQTALKKTGRGNDFLGWVTLPNDVTEEEIVRIEECAARMAAQSAVMGGVGIGGASLGARGGIAALRNDFAPYAKG